MAKTPKCISVVLRGAEAYLVACAGGPGIRWGVEPVYLVEAVEEPLAGALAIAISNAPTEFSGMPNLRDFRDPMLSAMHLKSIQAFEKGTKHFAIIEDDSEIKLERLIPDPNARTGLVADNDWTKTFSPRTELEKIARLILEAAPSSPTR